MISESRREYYAGAMLVLIGAGAAVIGWRYQFGSLTKMGPGFFPVSLGVLLIMLGLLVASTARMGVQAKKGVGDDLHEVHGAPDWRGWGCIAGSVIAFILLAEHAGLAPATFFCVFIAACGDKQSTIKGSVFLSLGITAFAILLFSYVLRVQIPVIKGF